ncbi:MAG: hypothetical protein OXU20_22600 [Myxococcales bacterium]|nr:hypothetical protein [Myxococcales bacterium]MDD9967676.1 hypothetical protein [Myxococcales bacterium]
MNGWLTWAMACTTLVVAACGEDVEGEHGSAIPNAATSPSLSGAGADAPPPATVPLTMEPTTGPAASQEWTPASGGPPDTPATGAPGAMDPAPMLPTAGEPTPDTEATDDPDLGPVASDMDDPQGSDPAAMNADPMADPMRTCDRACLIGFMDMYVAALEAKDPSGLPVADSLKYTENGVRSELGETVWASFSEMVPDSRLDFADPVWMNVGSQFVFYENGRSLVRYQARLKVEGGEITEIEAMATRAGDHFFFAQDNLEPQSVFFETPANPNTREELIAVTNLYIDDLEGKLTMPLPVDENCARYENGFPIVRNGAGFRENWGFMIEPRRIQIVDEAMGITWGYLPFYPGTPDPLIVGEAFKIWDGEFKMIQATMRYQSTAEWDD